MLAGRAFLIAQCAACPAAPAFSISCCSRRAAMSLVLVLVVAGRDGTTGLGGGPARTTCVMDEADQDANRRPQPPVLGASTMIPEWSPARRVVGESGGCSGCRGSRGGRCVCPPCAVRFAREVVKPAPKLPDPRPVVASNLRNMQWHTQPNLPHSSRIVHHGAILYVLILRIQLRSAACLSVRSCEIAGKD